jgi:hypothetical protein
LTACPPFQYGFLRFHTHISTLFDDTVASDLAMGLGSSTTLGDIWVQFAGRDAHTWRKKPPKDGEWHEIFSSAPW